MLKMYHSVFSASIKKISHFNKKVKDILTINGIRNCHFRPNSWQASNMMDIGVRPIFDESHDLFRKNARRFFQEQVAPHETQWQKEGQVSRDVWLQAGKAGFLGVNVPTKFGGFGADFLYSAILVEEQAYVNSTGPGFPVHSEIVMPYIWHYGTEKQCETFLPDMISGKCIGAIAMSEPGAGSDLQGIITNAKRKGDDWILNGSKVFITNGFMADLVIVMARTNLEAKSAAHGISLFLVPANTQGFRKGRKLEKMGFKSQDTAELFFEDVRLPDDSLLGEVDKGFLYIMQQLPQERLIIALSAAASCEFAYEETKRYVHERKAFGGKLSKLQTVTHTIADMKAVTSAVRCFTDQNLLVHVNEKLDAASASMIKFWVSEQAFQVINKGVQLHGGWGYMWEMPICRAFVDSRLQMIYGGSNEVVKEVVARSIFDSP